MSDEITNNDPGQNDLLPPTGDGGIGDNDIPSNIEELMHNAYLQYSLSVNVGRAIPDVRDGLKPGMRRILYAMRQLGLTKAHSYTKCATVVGEVIGKYHPHGDQAVYDTLVRMAQDFNMRCPLVDGQGNFGSIDGDSAAAYRYTECRMERLAEELLADIDRNTVDLVPTFDEKNSEPAVLPARFPNLLVNGSTGIGVGMATNIPPHNLAEVINATLLIIENPTCSVHELMQVMPGPDFPTGGEIHGVGSLIQLYETGRGVIRVRGKCDITEEKGRERIIHHRDALRGEQGDDGQADRRAGQREEDHRHLRPHGRIEQPRRHPGGDRDQEERHGDGGAEPALQAHPVRDQLRRALPGGGPQPARASSTCARSSRPTWTTASRSSPRRTRFELDKAEARAHILEGLLIAVNHNRRGGRHHPRLPHPRGGPASA